MTRSRKWVTIRATYAYLGCVGRMEFNLLARTRKWVTIKAIHAYLRCIGVTELN